MALWNDDLYLMILMRDGRKPENLSTVRLSQRSSYAYGGNGLAHLWRNGIISYQTS